MSVRHALLALLSEGPKYGLQLREEFEARTGEVWPLNVGQVYTTLQRLERDGLVESDGDGRGRPAEGLPDHRAAARQELAGWLRTPPDLSSPPRDELVIKVLVALRVPGTDVHDVIQVHRRYLVELMQQWTRLKEDEAEFDLSLALVVDAELFRLDCGGPLAGRRRRPHQAGRRPSADPPATTTRATDRRAAEGAAQIGGTTMSVLELRRRVKTYGQGAAEVHALRDIDLSVDAGAHGGRDGAERIGQVHAADHRRQPGGAEQRRGAVGGQRCRGMSRNAKARLRRRSIGYVFQDFNLLPGLTAAENVALPLELDGVPARKARAAGLQALDELGLAERAASFPDQLSGGERQRVAIARAVVGERQLLLADEPSGALDSVNGEAVMRLIHAACKRGVAAVVVTHDAQLASWADRVVFLRDGRVTDQTLPVPGPESLLTPGPGQ